MKRKLLIKCKSSPFKKRPVFYLLAMVVMALTSLNLNGGPITKESESAQATQNVTGTIVDSNGDALPGVSIVEKGTSNGTMSDIDGKYKISVPGNATLVFSFVGMETVEKAVNNQTTINITLNAGMLSLEDVVVVGYGKLKSNQVSSSIARVTSNEIADRPVARIDQAIQGKIAGIQVQEVSGAPGRSLAVKVRGNGSINYSTSPLYVVDGFPTSGDLNNINPGDIESIEVLKDAASAAIYGSRGSNGVILITTKSGSKGKTVIELDTYFGLQSRFSKVDVLNRDEYLDYAIEERTNSYIYSGGDLSVPEDKRHNYKFAIDPLWRSDPQSFPDNDWQDLIDRVAPIQSYTLSASGGTDKMKYYISNNYFDQKGIILNSDYKRYSMRANVESSMNKYLTLGGNLSISNSTRNDPNTDTNSGPISRSILVAPIVGLDQQTIDGGYYYYHANFFLNPVALAKECLNETKSNNIMSNFYAELNLMKNLKIRSSFGTNISAYKTHYYLDNNVNRGTGSVANESNSLTQNYLTENTINYDITKDDWALNLLGGFTYQEENYEYSSLAKTGFADDDIKTLNAGTVLSSGTTTAEKWSMISYLSRANLSYRDRYIMTASVRRDGSSRFGKDNRWGVFPSASLGWIISQEGFMENVKKQISNLKLRASFGTVGNNNIGNYSAIGLMSASNYIVGDAKVGGYSPSSFSNTVLGWEKTSTIDAGLDVGFINDRINLTFDYYVANTNDLLLQVQIPQVTGFSNALQNIGKVQNRG
ncbi:MAG TPA: SusC/RagA family TonB-linked outer membrane protein, partial [Bacteroidales bacterium]|nr:SusC/RagA family TonB-linked outer membrane protein [Bacteroidales bacterium]